MQRMLAAMAHSRILLGNGFWLREQPHPIKCLHPMTGSRSGAKAWLPASAQDNSRGLPSKELPVGLAEPSAGTTSQHSSSLCLVLRPPRPTGVDPESPPQ